jgi:hypothetical protein
MTAAPQPHIDIMRTVFPVVALKADEPGQAARPDFFGTAFAVAPGLFITAGHVVNEARAVGALALAGPTGDGHEPVGAARVLDFELFPNHDLALLKCNVSDVTLLNVWLASRLQLLTDVSAFGYARIASKSNTCKRSTVRVSSRLSKRLA